MPEQHNIFRSSGGSPLSRLFLSIKFKALIKIFDKNVLRGGQKQAQLRSFLFPSRPFLQSGYFSHASDQSSRVSLISSEHPLTPLPVPVW